MRKKLEKPPDTLLKPRPFTIIAVAWTILIALWSWLKYKDHQEAREELDRLRQQIHETER